MEFLKIKPWLSSEVSLYQIKALDDNNEIHIIGTLKLAVEQRNKEMYMQNIVTINDIVFEKSESICDAETLLPIKTKTEYNIEGNNISVQSEYSSSHIKMTAVTPKGTQKKKVKNESGVYDNIQVYQLVRALDFGKSKKHTTKIMCPQTAMYEDYDIQYHCDETVEVNNKKYDCIRVSICKAVDNSGRQFLLYSKDENKKLIRTLAGGQIIEFVETM